MSSKTSTPSANVERVYLTVNELADYIRVSRHTLYKWLRKGVFPVPFCRLERSLRFLRSDIDVWMDSKKEIPAAMQYELSKKL